MKIFYPLAAFAALLALDCEGAGKIILGLMMVALLIVGSFEKQ